MPSDGYQLTAEQIALSEERKRLKLQKQKEKAVLGKDDVSADPRGQILPREWLILSEPGQTPSRSDTHIVKVMTWNLLAQTLVRRRLFPTSDCLKSSQREQMLYREILSHNADVCCLQELDQTEKIFPRLAQAGYSYVYKAGPQKKHGSLIAYKKDRFTKVDERVVQYDAQTVRPESVDGVPLSENKRRGISFFTKNIGNLVALRHNSHEQDGLIVATTHLFWHPRYTYERARQAAILFREADSFRQALNCPHWPCIIAGDFNFPPDDAAYSLLIGDSLLPNQIARLAFSRVVHATIDSSVQRAEKSSAAKGDDDDDENGDGGGAEGESWESDPDMVIVDARRARPDDGLLADSELTQLFDALPRPISAYDEGLRRRRSPDVKNVLFGSRIPVHENRRGACEPVWTSYTHYWKTVLDYIFVLAPANRPVTVTGLSKPHPTESLTPGIPMQGICGSDHVSLCAELSWPLQP